MAIKTYLDSNVLINIFVDDADTVQRARGVITDSNRTFVVSDYVRLEVIPKMNYFHQIQQSLFCLEIFRKSTFVLSSQEIIVMAEKLAEKYGLSAMDALHAACAIASGADELVTFEKPSKPFFRIPREELAIVSLYERR
jgi:predicted nucleic acid-binding protein